MPPIAPEDDGQRRTSPPERPGRRHSRGERQVLLVVGGAMAAAVIVVAAIALVYDPSALADLPDGLAARRDVPYGPSPHHRLDIVFHPDDRPRPAIVMIHQGGWFDGDKDSYHGLMREYAGLGYATVSINFRPADESPFPAAVEDCKLAVRWLRTHAADYHVDPQRIGVMGWSSGGHLAMMVAGADESAGLDAYGDYQDTSSRVQAVVCWAGVYDLLLVEHGEFANDENDPVVIQFLGGPPRDRQDVARRASPITYLTRDDPPALILHGERDPRIDVTQARRLAEAFAALGRKDEVVILPGEDHGTDVLPRDPEVRQRVRRFLEEHLAIESGGEPPHSK